MSCVEKSWHLGLLVMQSIENSCKILSLMLCKISLNCTEMAYIYDIMNSINDEISFLTIPIT